MTTDSPETGQLDRWRRAYARASERMDELASDLSAEQLNFKPAPDRWSVAECLDHLSVTMRLYLDPMEPVVEQAVEEDRGKAGGGEPYERGPLVGRFLVGALRKPGRRYPAPGKFKPRRSRLDPDAVRGEFETQLARLRRVAGRCEGLDLGKLRMPWPLIPLIKLSLAQAFELQALHLHRHLDQAERVTREPGFPGA